MLAIALLSGLTGCSPAEGSALRLRGGRSNVLLVLVDGLGSEQLGEATPRLEELGQGGVRFEQLIANGVAPRPSAGALVTGRHPRQLELVGRRAALGPEQLTLAEVLQEQGYLTLGLSSSGELHSYYGFDQGFDEYVDQDLEDTSGSTSVSERSLALLDRNLGPKQRSPWLLQVHVAEPAPPWSASRAEVQAWRDAGSSEPRAQAELALVDRGIGELVAGLEERGLLEETLVVVVGTHGRDAASLSEAGLQVPLILEHPALPSGHQVDQLCDQVDLLSTVLHLLGWERPADLAGESLAGLVFGASRDESLSGVVISETGSPQDRSALRTHRHKLVSDPGEGLRLYRIDQGRDVPVDNERVQRRLAERLRAWEVTHPVVYQEPGPP